MRRGLWGVLLLATAAFFAMAGVRSGSSTSEKSSSTARVSQSGVRSGSAASDKSSPTRASQSPAADPAGSNIARADMDTLDFQLD